MILTPDILKFVNGPHARSRWFEVGPLEIYLRSGTRWYNGHGVNVIDVGNVKIADERKRGKGLFTKILGELETIAHESGRAVFVENLLNERLEKFLQRRGYTCTNPQDPKFSLCYISREL